MSSTKVFQFVGSFMVNKPNDLRPAEGQGLIPTKIIQANPQGNILGNLTTTALEGGFGGTDTSHRSMIYLSPSMTFLNSSRLCELPSAWVTTTAKSPCSLPAGHYSA